MIYRHDSATSNEILTLLASIKQHKEEALKKLENEDSEKKDTQNC